MTEVSHSGLVGPLTVAACGCAAAMVSVMAPARPGVAVMTDLCLAPGGVCACAEKLQASLQSQDNGATSTTADTCWRVRVPWWTSSQIMLPNTRYMQLLGWSAFSSPLQADGSGMPVVISEEQSRDSVSNTMARNRTPSPDRGYRERIPPPKLLFAPPATGPAPALLPVVGPAAARVAMVVDGVAPQLQTHPMGTQHAHEHLQPAPVSAPPQAAVGAEGLGAAAEEVGEEPQRTELVEARVASGARGAGPGRRGRRRRAAALVVATQLEKLEDKDPKSVIVVRNISALGFESAQILRSHFEAAGAEVEEVLLANAHEKQTDCSRSVRLRASGFGFVLLHRASDAAKILQEGATRDINGVAVQVRQFEPRTGGDSSESEALIPMAHQ